MFLLRDYPLDFKEEIPHNFHDFLQKLSPFTIYRIYHEQISDNSFKESYFSQFLWICYHDEKLLSKEEYELLLSFPAEIHWNQQTSQQNSLFLWQS